MTTTTDKGTFIWEALDLAGLDDLQALALGGPDWDSLWARRADAHIATLSDKQVAYLLWELDRGMHTLGLPDLRPRDLAIAGMLNVHRSDLLWGMVSQSGILHRALCPLPGDTLLLMSEDGDDYGQYMFTVGPRDKGRHEVAGAGVTRWRDSLGITAPGLWTVHETPDGLRATPIQGQQAAA